MLIKTIKNTITSHNLIQPSEKLLLGCSGGPDSVCLLKILSQLRKELSFELSAAYINHNIRKTSISEQAIVKRICKELNVNFYHRTVPGSNKKKSEEWLRNYRFKYLREIKKKIHADKIVLAHNKDDNVETILFNIFRGTGLLGITGIDYRNEDIIHPIIDVTKTEILKYIKSNSLTYCIDETNEMNVYSRNIIRNQIIPIVKENINSGLYNNVIRISSIVKDTLNYIDYRSSKHEKIFKSKSSDKYEIYIKKYNKLYNIIQYNIINKIVKKLSNVISSLTFNQFDEILKIINSTGSTKINIGDIEIIKRYDILIITLEKIQIKIIKPKLLDKNFKRMSTADWVIIRVDNPKQESGIGYLKSNMFPLSVRGRHPGDRIEFYQNNKKRTKKIKNFFIDKKLPIYMRDQIPIIENKHGVIIAVGNYYIHPDCVKKHKDAICIRIFEKSV